MMRMLAFHRVMKLMQSDDDVSFPLQYIVCIIFDP